MADKIFNIAVLVWTILSILVSIVFLVMTTVKKARTKSQSNKLDTKKGTAVSDDTVFDRIYERVIDYMKVAEVGNNVLKQLGASTGRTVQLGTQKLAEVLSKIKIDCMTEGVEYDESFWKTKIESLIDFSKVVNGK